MNIYIWKRPDGTPFYVGMSKGLRRTDPTASGGRGWLCKKVLHEIGPKNVIVEIHTRDTVEEAAALEQHFIALYGRIQLNTGPLTNLKVGGDGWQGMSDEGKARLSAHMKAHNPMHNPEIRAKATAKMQDPDVKAKFSGDNNPAKRPEVREKLLAKWQDPEYRATQQAKKLGRPIHSEAHKEELRNKLLDPANPMREYHKVLNSDPAIAAKRKAAF